LAKIVTWPKGRLKLEQRLKSMFTFLVICFGVLLPGKPNAIACVQYLALEGWAWTVRLHLNTSHQQIRSMLIGSPFLLDLNEIEGRRCQFKFLEIFWKADNLSSYFGPRESPLSQS